MLKEMIELNHWLFDDDSIAMEGRFTEMLKRRMTSTNTLTKRLTRANDYGSNSFAARVEPHVVDDLKKIPADNFWKKFFTNPRIIDEAYEFIDWESGAYSDLDEDVIDETPTEIEWARGREGELICQKILREKKDIYFKSSVVKEIGKPSKIVRFGEFSVLTDDDLRQIWIPLEVEVQAVFVVDSDFWDKDPTAAETTQLKLYTQWEGSYAAARAGIRADVTAMEVDLSALSSSFEECLQELYEYDKRALEIGKRQTHTANDLAVLKEASRAADKCIRTLKKTQNLGDRFIDLIRTKVASAAPIAGTAGGAWLGIACKSDTEPALPYYGALVGLILGAGLWANLTKEPKGIFKYYQSAASLKKDLEVAVRDGCTPKKSRELLSDTISFIETAREQYDDLYELIRRELKGNAPAFHFD